METTQCPTTQAHHRNINNWKFTRYRWASVCWLKAFDQTLWITTKSVTSPGLGWGRTTTPSTAGLALPPCLLWAMHWRAPVSGDSDQVLMMRAGGGGPWARVAGSALGFPYSRFAAGVADFSFFHTNTPGQCYLHLAAAAVLTSQPPDPSERLKTQPRQDPVATSW